MDSKLSNRGVSSLCDTTGIIRMCMLCRRCISLTHNFTTSVSVCVPKQCCTKSNILPKRVESRNTEIMKKAKIRYWTRNVSNNNSFSYQSNILYPLLYLKSIQRENLQQISYMSKCKSYDWRQAKNSLNWGQSDGLRTQVWVSFIIKKHKILP